MYPSDLGTEDLSEWSVSVYRDALKWGRRAFSLTSHPRCGLLSTIQPMGMFAGLLRW